MTSEAHRTQGPNWRALIAALADPELRVLIARLLLDEDVTEALDAHAPSRRAHLRRRLLGSGLAAEADGALIGTPEVFAALLAQDAKPRPTGIDRFVRDGRLHQVPARPADRAAVHAWLVDACIGADESLTERELTERLRNRVADPVSFRRALVDAGLVTRSANGADYRRASGSES